ncbi:hypothetical protein ASZ78_011160, partial [Callipepla squamata]
SSESEEEEEEWEPKSKTAKRPRLTKKNEAKPKKIAVPRSGVAGKKVKKITVKEEMDVSLPIAPAEDNKVQLQKLKEENGGAKLQTLKQKPLLPKKPEVSPFKAMNAKSLESDEKPSTSAPVVLNQVKHEKSEEDSAFDEPPLKKMKSATSPEGKPVKNLGGNKIKEEFEMNWDIVQTTPYKTGSKGTKAQRARQLGLEPAALSLLQSPMELNLFSYIRPNTKGLANIQEVEAGVQHILADIFAKDKDTLDFIRRLCQQRYICIQSALAKVSSKNSNEKDIDKFQLYHEFSCNIKNIQHHQILAINRGENLKILTVKVNIPDGVKNEFCWWCVNERWRPKQFLKPELMRILRNSVEDAYKRLIYPLLCREFRSKLTSDAEKESVMMFGRNLRQLLLTSPVRGRTLMGVDPGYKHGCKLAIISPTSQILHTDIVYLHSGQGFREAEKIKRLLLQFSCSTVVIGNGTACRETEAYFADLIMKKYFAPLDVVY